MSHRHPIKETVKLIYITKPNEKIRFQIRHPENVHAIVGIAVTCSMIKLDEKKELGNIAGYLSLAIPEKGDVVFGEDVKIDTNDYTEPLEQLTRALTSEKSVSFSGKKRTYFNTHYHIKDAILEGYYEDTYLPAKRNYQITVGGIKGEVIGQLLPEKNESYYCIRLYIRYQTTQK